MLWLISGPVGEGFVVVVELVVEVDVKVVVLVVVPEEMLEEMLDEVLDEDVLEVDVLDNGVELDELVVDDVEDDKAVELVLAEEEAEEELEVRLALLELELVLEVVELELMLELEVEPVLTELADWLLEDKVLIDDDEDEELTDEELTDEELIDEDKDEELIDKDEDETLADEDELVELLVVDEELNTELEESTAFSLYTFNREGPPQYSVELSLHGIRQSSTAAGTDPAAKLSPQKHSPPYCAPAYVKLPALQALTQLAIVAVSIPRPLFNALPDVASV